MKLKCLAALSLVGFVAVTGCKKEDVTDPVCDIAKKAVAGAAQGVAAALACSNVAAVEATLTKPIDDLQLCSNETPQGLIGDLVCGQVGKLIVDMGTSALPAEWGCTGGALGDKVKEVVVEKCKQAIPF